MQTDRISPTSAQRLLVNIGMLVQFHLAAVGHIAIWLLEVYNIAKYGYDGFEVGIFLWFIIPISFGFLIAFYVIFRLLLAFADFGTALVAMITIDIFHAILMGVLGFMIVPIRLSIPIVLYAIAYYYYRTTLLHEKIRLQEHAESAYFS